MFALVPFAASFELLPFTRPQTIQSPAFISNLTNSNGCGNLWPKVRLTVSLYRSLLFPQPGPFLHSPQALSPLSTAFTPNRPLTPLSTAFTQKHRGGVPLYSMVATAGQAAHPKALTPFKMNTCKSVSKSRTLTIFRMNTYVKTRGGGPHPIPDDEPSMRLCSCSAHLLRWASFWNRECPV